MNVMFTHTVINIFVGYIIYMNRTEMANTWHAKNLRKFKILVRKNDIRISITIEEKIKFSKCLSNTFFV